MKNKIKKEQVLDFTKNYIEMKYSKYLIRFMPKISRYIQVYYFSYPYTSESISSRDVFERLRKRTGWHSNRAEKKKYRSTREAPNAKW